MPSSGTSPIVAKSCPNGEPHVSPWFQPTTFSTTVESWPGQALEARRVAEDAEERARRGVRGEHQREERGDDEPPHPAIISWPPVGTNDAMRLALAAGAVVLVAGAFVWIFFGDPALFYVALGVAAAEIGRTAL